jgi:hypothetical protein
MKQLPMRTLLSYCTLVAGLLFSSCQSSKNIPPNLLPTQLLKDTLTIDTTFVFERSPDFTIQGDMMYGAPVGIIKPGFELTAGNYYSYKTASVNFIFAGNTVPYNLAKRKYTHEATNDSLASSVLDSSASKVIKLKPGYILYEKRLKAKCFLIGYEENQKLIDPDNGKPTIVKKILYYGIYQVN